MQTMNGSDPKHVLNGTCEFPELYLIQISRIVLKGKRMNASVNQQGVQQGRFLEINVLSCCTAMNQNRSQF